LLTSVKVRKLGISYSANNYQEQNQGGGRIGILQRNVENTSKPFRGNYRRVFK